MKKTWKLLLPMLTILILIGSFTILTFSEAAAAEPSLRIKEFSLSLENAVYMNFKVSGENIADAKEIKLLAWDEAPDSYQKDTAEYVLNTSGTEAETGYELFQYTNLAAKDMTKMVYACAYYTDGETEVYSSPVKFSVAMYANMQKTATNPDEGLIVLIDQMLEYGAAAQTYFNYNTEFLATDEVHMVRVANGKLSDGFALGWYQEGSQITMTANEPDDGYAFSHWENSAGEEVGTEETITIPVTKVDTYTAVYKPLYQISIINGTVNNVSSGIFTEGSTVTLVANEPADGYVFSHWTNSLGETVGSSKALTVTVTQAETYAAVYETIEESLFVFTELSDGTYSVKANPDATLPAELEIPATYNGKAVTKIERGAFSQCDNLTNVTIPNSITSIGDNAFAACTNLKNIEIPNSVTNMGLAVFTECRNLTSVTLSNKITRIGAGTFYVCTSLESITIPKSVTVIDAQAFEWCNSLNVVHYDGTYKQWNAIAIGDANTELLSATVIFPECSTHDYTSVTTPPSCTAEGKTVYTCQYCGDTYQEVIPSAGHDHVDGVCRICGDVWIDPGLQFIVQGYNCMVSKYTGSATDLRIPVAYQGLPVTGFDFDALAGCTTLKSIVIPEGIQVICDGAFSGCSNLISIRLPSTLTYLGSYAFDGCSSLTDIIIPDGITSIGNSAFEGCCSLTSITIPANVTSIGSNAFSGCTGLETVTFAEGSRLTTIDTSAFHNTKNLSNPGSLTSIIIPASVKTIGVYAFYGQRNLTSVIFDGNSQLTSIDTYAFGQCNSLISITVPASTTVIEDYAFNGCYELKTVIFAEGSQLSAIKRGAFSACPALTTLTPLPDGLTSIGAGAFEDTGIEIITIPSSVTTIADHVFGGFNIPETIYYNGTQKQWNSITIGRDNSWTSHSTIIFAECPGHTYEEVVTSATCTEAGKTVYTCKFCDDCYEVAIPASGHSWTDVEAKAETCLESGYTAHKVCHCGAIEGKELLPAAGHSYEAFITPATCTKEGNTVYTCNACGDTYTDEVTPATGHTYSSNTVPATCTEEGETVYTCNDCGDTYTEVIPANGHTYTTVTTPATCSQEGKIVHDCENCDHSYEETLPIVDHSFEENANECDMCGVVAVRTADDLKKISSNPTKNYLLMNSIDLGGAEWTPIACSESSPFSGNFDGNGFTVSNFKITGSCKWAGLFGCVFGGTITDLRVRDFTINVYYNNSASYVGGLVAYAKNATIQNCAINTGNITGASDYVECFVGGLIGRNYAGYVTGCSSNCTVTCNTSNSCTGYAGGLIAYNVGGIRGCVATGDVKMISTSTDQYTCGYAGGLVGSNPYNSAITNSEANCAVYCKAPKEYMGAFVGQGAWE